jgi:hypothetical protein
MAAATALADPGVPAVPPLLAVGVRIEAMQRAQASAGAGLVGEAEALRRHAVALLAAARAGVEAAGDVATNALTRAAEAAPEARRFWDSTIRPAAGVGTGHAALDWAGMAPGVGAAPDAVNTGWYATEGHWEQAGWSAIAMAPAVGDWLAATRKVVKFVGAVDDVGRGRAARSDQRPRMARHPGAYSVRSSGLWTSANRSTSHHRGVQIAYPDENWMRSSPIQ